MQKTRFSQTAMTFLLGFFIVTSAFSESIVNPASKARCDFAPGDWQPSLDQVADTLNEQENNQSPLSQQAMNLNSQNLADIKDAQLFITYVQLAQTLDIKGRIKLCSEQRHWLDKRAKSAEASVESKDGSLGPLEYSSAFRKLTEERLAELQKRLQQPVSINKVVKKK